MQAEPHEPNHEPDRGPCRDGEQHNDEEGAEIGMSALGADVVGVAIIQTTFTDYDPYSEPAWVIMLISASDSNPTKNAVCGVVTMFGLMIISILPY
jgi:hypothetical protein